MALNGSIAHLRFINETAGGGHKRAAPSPVKRQLVRSQAMIAVRRKQRQDAEIYLQLRWTHPKLGSKSDSESRPADANDKRKPQTTSKYRFVAETHSAGEKNNNDSEESASSDPANSEWQSPDTRQETFDDENALAQRAASVGSGCIAPARDLIESFGGGRRNPFESYPVPFNNEVNELMDHCESTLPILMLAIHAGNLQPDGVDELQIRSLSHT